MNIKDKYDMFIELYGLFYSAAYNYYETNIKAEDSCFTDVEFDNESACIYYYKEEPCYAYYKRIEFNELIKYLKED